MEEKARFVLGKAVVLGTGIEIGTRIEGIKNLRRMETAIVVVGS